MLLKVLLCHENRFQYKIVKNPDFPQILSFDIFRPNPTKKIGTDYEYGNLFYVFQFLSN